MHMRSLLIIKLRPFPVCSRWPAQEEVANVFLFESLLNRDGSMSPGRHTVGIKEHLTAVTPPLPWYVYMTRLFVHE